MKGRSRCLEHNSTYFHRQFSIFSVNFPFLRHDPFRRIFGAVLTFQFYCLANFHFVDHFLRVPDRILRDLWYRFSYKSQPSIATRAANRLPKSFWPHRRACGREVCAVFDDIRAHRGYAGSSSLNCDRSPTRRLVSCLRQTETNHIRKLWIEQRISIKNSFAWLMNMPTDEWLWHISGRLKTFLDKKNNRRY